MLRFLLKTGVIVAGVGLALEGLKRLEERMSPEAKENLEKAKQQAQEGVQNGAEVVKETLHSLSKAGEAQVKADSQAVQETVSEMKERAQSFLSDAKKEAKDFQEKLKEAKNEGIEQVVSLEKEFGSVKDQEKKDDETIQKDIKTVEQLLADQVLVANNQDLELPEPKPVSNDEYPEVIYVAQRDKKEE